MNYTQHYTNLIGRARNRILEEYTESHHIIPQCQRGSNNISNLVELTPEEHYVAHLLLVKMYPENRQLIHAAVMMTVNGNGHKRNNKLYGWLRRKHAIAISKSQTGSGNSQYGKYWICEQSTGTVVRIDMETDIPSGWIRGKTQNTLCEVCGLNTETKQRRFCKDHRPEIIPPKSTMSKGSASAAKLAKYCRSRTKEQHPQYGKRWVHNNTIQQMVPLIKLQDYINSGWKIGKLRGSN